MKTINPFFRIMMLIAFMSFQNAMAQTDSCILYLKNANSGYESRDFDGAIKLLNRAVGRCNLDRADQIQAHKLLALSYLAIDNLEAADKEAEIISKINPNYTPDKFKDDPRYSALFKKFTPVPILRIGFSAGFNRSKIDVAQTYSIVHDDNAPGLGSYKSKGGFQLGITGECRVWKNVWIHAGGQFRQSSYEHTLDSVENSTVNYSEKLSYFDIPLSVKYYISDKTIAPYVEAGAMFSFLTGALSTTTRDDQKDLVNRIDYRNTFMTGFFGGAGVAYKIKGISLFASLRYSHYGKNVNKDNTRYADMVNVFKYYYIDDDFRMHNWQFTVGVNYSLLYKNRKTN